MKRHISIHWSVSTNILIDCKTINGDIYFDTNKYGEYAAVFYRVFSLPEGLGDDQIKNAGPESGIKWINIEGKPFRANEDFHKVAAGEIQKIKAFAESETGTKAFAAIGDYCNVRLKDLPLS